MSRESGWGWAGEGPRGNLGGVGLWGEPLLKGRGLKTKSAQPFEPQWAHLENGLPRLRSTSRRVEARWSGVQPPSRSEFGYKKGAWRGAGEKPAPIPANRPSAHRPVTAASWPGLELAPCPGELGKGRRKAALRELHARGLPGWGQRGPGAWRPRPHHAAPEAARHPAVLCFPSLSLPLPSPVPRSPGGGARGAASGAAGVSGAALAHAPGPGAVQLPRPQLCLLRACPCTSLLNWLGGVVGRRLLPLQTPPPYRPTLPRHFRFLFLRAVEAKPARPFPQIREPYPGKPPALT